MQTTALPNQFPTTNWTAIRRVAVTPEELGAFLATYWGPVYAYIRRKGRDRDAAADLTQDFITEVVLERELIARADQNLGRFRTYLLTALCRFMVDDHRKRVGRSGNRPSVISMDEAMLAAAEPDVSDDPDRAFDRQWATTVLEQALGRVEADYRKRGKDAHWAIFEARVLRPAFCGCEPTDVDSLAAEHDVTVSQIYSMLNSVKRSIKPAVAELVLETLEDPADLDDELAEIRRMLALPFV